MKHIGNLLLVIAVTVGALSASSAYVIPLDSVTVEQLTGMTLNAPAGLQVGEDGAPTKAPLAAKGDVITAELAAQLKAQADQDLRLNDDTPPVSRVQVQQFRIGLWPGKWFFLLSVLALVAGGYLVKTAGRREIEAAHEEHKESGVAPEEALTRMKMVVDQLILDLPGLDSDEARNERIVEQIGGLQRDEVQFFVEARTLLIARLGLGGFASLMDRFAASERQINRAWSAAADECFDEAWECVNRASPLIEETMGRLQAPGNT